MSETRIRPRFELEEQPAPRLESVPAPVALPPGRGLGSFGLLGAGAGVLVFGLALLAVGDFVADQFARGPALGWLTLGVAVLGWGLVAACFWRELRGLAALRRVDRLRAELADPVTAQRAAIRWAGELPEGAALASALAVVPDHATVIALLRGGAAGGRSGSLAARVDALGYAAGVQIFAMTAAIPSPALDGVLVAWRGVRLVREVAALHGMRPGLLGTLSLLRRVALSAAGVVATDVLVDTMARAALSNPLLAHVVGEAAASGVAARRMLVLARATACACSPVPPDA